MFSIYRKKVQRMQFVVLLHVPFTLLSGDQCFAYGVKPIFTVQTTVQNFTVQTS